MNPDDVRAYARRPWHTAETLTRQHWARETARRGPQATFEASLALWEHMRRLRPEWPSPEDRREDLKHHLRLKRAIDRAADAFHALPNR
jgi:hypothetical protein